MLEILKKIVTKLNIWNNALFNYPVIKQLAYVDQLAEPRDDIDRSFLQYKCQMKLQGTFFWVCANLASCILLARFFCRKNLVFIDSSEYTKNGVFFSNGLSEDYLPSELRRKCHDIFAVDLIESRELTKGDCAFIKRIWNSYPFRFYFVYKIVIKIAAYRACIMKYRPSYIIVSAEYSFTSSALTAFCNLNNIQHINIQHGEKLLYMRESFFHFNTCYFWDKYYIDIMLRLRASEGQFVVSVPPVISQLRERVEKIRIEKDACFDYKYFLGDETKSELVAIYCSLTKLGDQGIKVCVRPHPRYTDYKRVSIIFKDIEIENPMTVSLEDSLAATKGVISLRSVALFQAFNCDKIIVIDDVTNKDKFAQLQGLQYRMLNIGERLSTLLF